MDLCQKSETDLENSENNEIQSTEETELTCTCPDERSEKNHVCCLLSISDITCEQDERAGECVIGTGWEEAVHGWGKTSPTACIWSKGKKLKKARVGEGAGSGCLVCVSLSQGSVEARPPVDAGKLEAGAVAGAGREKDRCSPLEIREVPQDPSTASRGVGNICFPTYIPGGKKSLQIKEFIWCTEDWAGPETIRGQAVRHPGAGVSRGLPSRALLVLPPLKPLLPNSLDVQAVKVPSVEKAECVACACGLKTGDERGEKRPGERAEHLKAHDTLPCPAPASAADAKQCCLCWALLPEKSLACPPDTNHLRYLTTLQLLQKKGVQNYKAKFKAKELRPPMGTQKHVLPEASRTRMLETKVFPRPLLPSLTVSRVVIPVSTHRVL
ncbi:uncharacterized protein C16orf46 homolog [Carlito syrichta]|uniref:Uncharacterized protein C16orf46 homolog n=1 Tax=Carlito syrichta TaxID=1868482 RepID=A0A1U7UD31_CARSF|nr:uncharacterized protein C16orf46 homolog [Carlito syrichta]